MLMSSAASALVRGTGLRRGRRNLNGGSLRGTAAARRPCLPKAVVSHPYWQVGGNSSLNRWKRVRWRKLRSPVAPQRRAPVCDQAAKSSEKTFQ